MKRITGILAGLIMFAALSGAAAGDPTINGSNAESSSNKSITHQCSGTEMGDGDNSIVFNGPTELWPPNHKFRTVTVTANGGSVGLSPSEMVGLDTTVTSNEPADGIGDGHTLVDAKSDPASGMNSGRGSTAVSWQLRGERSGNQQIYTGDGRTYTIDAHAMFDNGLSSCNASFEVHVPHDMGNN